MPRVDNLPFPQSLKADFTHPSPSVASACGVCYLAEHVIKPMQDRLPPRQETVNLPTLVNIRILGHLLSQFHFLLDTAVSEVARSIISCRAAPGGTDETDIEALNKLGEFYRDSLLLPLRKFKGQTPLSSSSSSEASSDAPSPLSEHALQLMEDEVEQMLTETPKSCKTSRKLAMQREDHRCIVTRILDREFAVDLCDLTGEVYKGVVASLAVCRIFTEPINMYFEDKENKDDDYGNPWALLKSLGYTDIVNDFATDDKVNSLANIMMMVYNLRYSFDSLSVWFEPIEHACDRYRLCSVWKLPHGLIAGQEVTFQSMDPRRLPLPNREYLRLHAACCRVAHLSGASVLFDELEKDSMDRDPGP